MGEKEIAFTIYLWRKYQKDRKFDIFTTKLIIMLLCACMEVNSINEELKSIIDFHGHIIKLRFENLNEEKKNR
jgi:hypothetical protein